jgi:endonuclease/exonuclease/phosphatase family metal-dependent hydrolase
MHRFPLFVCLAVAIAACKPIRPALEVTPLPSLLACIGESKAIMWVDVSDKPQRSDIDSWCHSVGPPVVSNVPASQDGSIRRLRVLSWNVHVGGGDVSQVVQLLRREANDERAHDTGIVLLLQEVFRAGDDVPASLPALFTPPGRIAPRRFAAEIGHLAAELGMSVAYVPSMRNGGIVSGTDREDRGSAILSTEPLSDITAIELPMLKQRRVVVMATVTPRGAEVPPLRVMATHLDTLGPRGAQARALAGYISTLPPEPPLVMGGDLNSLWGTRDVTVTTLGGVMNMEPCGTGSTHLLGRFDYIFSTLRKSPSRTCETLKDKYSSDHRPVLLTLDW